jgi:hypothetical protein
MRRVATVAATAGLLALTAAACARSQSENAPVRPVARPAPALVTPMLTAEQIADRMGMAGDYTAYTVVTDPNHLLGRQREYTSKINWSVGSIEVFPDHADAARRLAYLSLFSAPLGDGYDYLTGDYLLRLSSVMTPVQAAANHAAFAKAVQS